MSRAEDVERQHVAEVSKAVMEHGIARLVAEAAMSLMLSESADSTTTVVFKHLSSRLPSGKVVLRKANQTEFVVR